jgi:hypothetical protein
VNAAEAAAFGKDEQATGMVNIAIDFMLAGNRVSPIAKSALVTGAFSPDEVRRQIDAYLANRRHPHDFFPWA